MLWANEFCARKTHHQSPQNDPQSLWPLGAAPPRPRNHYLWLKWSRQDLLLEAIATGVEAVATRVEAI